MGCIGQEVHLGQRPGELLPGLADLADQAHRCVCQRCSYQDQAPDERNQEHARDVRDLFHAL